MTFVPVTPGLSAELWRKGCWQDEYEFPPEVAESVRTRAAGMLSDVVGGLARSHPAVECTTSLVEGDARATLVRASRAAALTVVGSRGRGLLLGSTSQTVLAHATCPVIVVRHKAD